MKKKKSLKAGAGIVLLLEPHQIFVFQPCLTPLLWLGGWLTIGITASSTKEPEEK